MNVKQISIFLENKKGRLAELTKVLAENSIDISALSIADTTDFGILRLIVNQPDTAKAILRERGFAVKSTDVIAIGVNDKPGGLAVALDALEKEDIGIEYMYAFVSKTANEALVIIRADNAGEANRILGGCNDVRVLDASEVYSL